LILSRFVSHIIIENFYILQYNSFDFMNCEPTLKRSKIIIFY